MRKQLLVGIIALIGVSLLVGFTQKPAPAAKAASINRFQVFYSPHLRDDTFLVDTVSGKVWRFVAGDNDRKFVRVSIKPNAPPAGTTPGRYAVTFSPSMREDTFLLDTITGRTWGEVVDEEDGDIYFTAIEVQGMGKR
jgi:hypothetical protein